MPLRSSKIALLYVKTKIYKGFGMMYVLSLPTPRDSQAGALSCYVQGGGLSAILKCGVVGQEGERRAWAGWRPGVGNLLRL